MYNQSTHRALSNSIPWIVIEGILKALTMVSIPVYKKNAFNTKNIKSVSSCNGSIVENAVSIWFVVHCMVSRWSKHNRYCQLHCTW